MHNVRRPAINYSFLYFQVISFKQKSTWGRSNKYFSSLLCRSLTKQRKFFFSLCRSFYRWFQRQQKMLAQFEVFLSSYALQLLQSTLEKSFKLYDAQSRSVSKQWFNKLQWSAHPATFMACERSHASSNFGVCGGVRVRSHAIPVQACTLFM